MGDPKTPDHYRWAIALLVLLVAVLHLSGLRARLPYGPANDEHVYVWHLDLFRASPEERARNPSYGFYPHLVSRLASLVPSLSSSSPPRTSDEELARASSDYVRVRLVVCLFALLVVPATWSVARRLVDARAALLASALAGTSLLFAWYASEARPHAAFGALAWVALAFALEARQRGSMRAFVLAGLAAGLALATLQSGVFLLLPLVAAHCLRPSGERLRKLYRLAAALAVALLVAFPFHPFVFAHSDSLGLNGSPGSPSSPSSPSSIGQRTPAGATNFFSHDLWLDAFDGSGFLKLCDALWNYEPVLVVLPLAGLLVRVLRPRTRMPAERRADFGVVLAFVVSYALVFGLYRMTFPRFATPLVPFLAIGAAWGTAELALGIAAAVRKAHREQAFVAVASALVFTIALVPVLGLARLRLLPDTSEEAAAWIAANVARERESIALLASLDLPLLRAEPPLAPGFDRVGSRQSPWRVHQAAVSQELRAREGWTIHEMRLRAEVEDPAAYFDKLGAQWVVLEPWDRPQLRELLTWLRSHAELRARFVPSSDPDDERPFLLHDEPGVYVGEACWAARMLRVRRLGTVIEVYRLRG